MSFQRDAAGAGAPPPSRGLVFFQSARSAATPLSALAFIAERCAGLDPEHHTHETEKKERRAPPAARRGGWGRMDEEGGGLGDEEDGRPIATLSTSGARLGGNTTRHDTTKTREEHRANGTEVERARARGVEHSRRRERRGVFSLSTREGGRRRRRAPPRRRRVSSRRKIRRGGRWNVNRRRGSDPIPSRSTRERVCALRTTRAARRTRGRDETTRVADLAEDGGGAEEDGKKTRFLIFFNRRKKRTLRFTIASVVRRPRYLSRTDRVSRFFASAILRRGTPPPSRPVASVASRRVSPRRRRRIASRPRWSPRSASAKSCRPAAARAG